MKPQEIDIRATAHASAATVYRLLDDSSSWPSWTPIDSHEPVAAPGPDGRGELRLFHTGRITVRERIVERVPNRRHSYVLLGGLALRDYRADVDLQPVAEGTAIRWHTTFKPKVPGFGWVYRRALERATQEFVDGLVRRSAELEAEQRSGESAAAAGPA